VVGSGQSGAQIAEDLHLAGRKVHLVTGNAPRCARFYRGRDVVDWLWDIGQYEITVADDGMGHKRHDTNHYLTGRDGGRDIDLRAFALQGMALYGRMISVERGRMIFEPNLKSNLDEADLVYNGINALIDRHIAAKGIFAPEGAPYVPLWEPASEILELDLVAEGVGAIVWATGFVPDWSYARLPVFDGTGYPVHRRGVTAVPGALRSGAVLALDVGVRPVPQRRARRRAHCPLRSRTDGGGERGLLRVQRAGCFAPLLHPLPRSSGIRRQPTPI
jgi:putative flavoprotein involved in K+ transport